MVLCDTVDVVKLGTNVLLNNLSTRLSTKSLLTIHVVQVLLQVVDASALQVLEPSIEVPVFNNFFCSELLGWLSLFLVPLILEEIVEVVQQTLLQVADMRILLLFEEITEVVRTSNFSLPGVQVV